MEERTPSEKEEIITEVIGFSPKKLWITFIDLLFKPGNTVEAYCNGQRGKYISPIAYFLIAYGANFIIYRLSGYFDYLQEKGDIAKMASIADTLFQSSPKLHAAFLQAFHIVFSENGILILLVPTLIATWWLLFRKLRKPDLNHFYFVLYITAEQTYLMLIPILLYFWSFSFAPVLLWLGRAIDFVIFLFAAKQFYGISYLNTAVRVLIAQYVLIYLPLAIFLFSAQAILTVAIYFFKP